MVERPEEAVAARLVLADWLEDHGDPRHELIRLRHQPGYRPTLNPHQRQERVVELLVGGLRPCVPEWTNALGMRFVWCPPGTFLMGSPADEEPREAVEGPVHAVTLTHGFWLGATQVTQAQWRAIIGDNPADHAGEELPVETVTWQECADFCGELAELHGLPYALPTEAEWEYACRAGTTTPYWWGPTFDAALARAVRQPGRSGPVAAGSLPPNPWGLHEVHGNLWEWVADHYGPYPEEPVTDPRGPESGDQRVSRGASWASPAWHARSACRNWRGPGEADEFHGFRVCLRVPGWPEGVSG
jgi:uncharacterized protein (TIGR02996 family)